jgi:hypothetical protein
MRGGKVFYKEFPRGKPERNWRYWSPRETLEMWKIYAPTRIYESPEPEKNGNSLPRTVPFLFDSETPNPTAVAAPMERLP